MDKKLFRSLILLITYTILLGMFLINHAQITAFFKKVVETCLPLFIGFGIAFVLNRPCNFFSRLFRRYLPAGGARAARPLAVVVSYLILLGLIALLFSFVIPSLTESIRTFVGSLSTYAANLQQFYDWVVETLNLESFGSVDLSNLSNALSAILSNALNAMTSAVPQLVGATARLVSWVVTIFLSAVFSVYLLASGPRLISQARRIITAYLPPNLSGPLLRVARLTADTFTNFVTGQATEAVILGVLCFIGMSIFRFDYAPLISVIVAVCALIPIAGAYLGGVVSCLLLVMIDPMQAVWFLVFLVVLQQLEGNIIYPRVVGTSIGMPGLWVLASVTVGGGLFGFAGMILSVPITAVVYTLLRADVNRRNGAGGQDGQNCPNR